MQPDDLIKKRARKVVDAGSVTLAHFMEAIDTNDKLDALLAKEIEFPEQQPFPEIPEYPTEISIDNLPEIQRVEVTNFPKQESPVINIEAPKAPIVNVEAPIVHMNHDEVISELQNIAEILSLEEVEKTEKVEIVDKEGKDVDFKELFDSLGRKIGNIKTVVSGGGGGLNQDQLRATLLTTQGVSYATLLDDVSTTSVTYIGKAGISSSTSSALWQIMKMDESGTPTTLVTTWADGDSLFNNVWDNRTSLTYS